MEKTMTSRFLSLDETERLLHDSNSTSSGGDHSHGNEGMRGIGVFFLVALSVAAAVAGWKFFNIWKAQRERHLLQLQSARADRVLGDMQMVPGEEYDDDDGEDPELL